MTQTGGAAPEVSIIIPAYNAAATLERAVASLQKQSFADWEAVVVNDGSTDDTRAVADAIAAREPRVRVLHQENRGASAARNTGLRAARGRWIGFLDSDDWFAPTFLAALLDLRTASPDAGVLYCDFALVDADGAVQEEQRVPDMSDPFSVLGRSCSLSVHCALTRADIMARAGEFDEDLAINEDWDLWQRIARTGTPFRGVKEILAFYYTRPSSLSRRKVEALASDGIKVIERIFSADPTLPSADPRYVNGLPAEERLGIELEWIVMSAGNAIALDIDPLPFLDLVPGLDQAIVLPEDLAETLNGALSFAACVTVRELANQWDRLGPRVEAFLAALGARVGQPRAIDMARAHVLRGVFGPGAWIAHYRSDLVHAERVDLSRPLPTIDPNGREAVVVDLHDGARALGLVMLPAVGPVPAPVLAEAIGRAAPFWLNRKDLVKNTPVTGLPALAVQSVVAGVRSRGWGLRARSTRSVLNTAVLKERARVALLRGFGASIERRVKASGSTEAWDQAVARIAATEEAAVANVPAVEAKADERQWRDDVEVNSPAYWDQVFETENPWAYDSPYEQVKYEQTMSLIPGANGKGEKPGRAIELACAEGHFTVQFAPMVGELLATDISQLGLDRAKQRCDAAGHTNVRYQQLDFFNNPVPGEFDLIVCSEVLYEAPSREQLHKIAKNIATHLAPGGALVTAHIIEVTEERDRSGFDWGGVFGAKSITDALLATGELQLEEEIETELYRVQRYRRAPAKIEPLRRHEEMGAPPERDYAYHVVWGGTEATWAEVAHERALAVPILMYHRIAEADEGPASLRQYRVSPAQFEEQMRWLRRHGYHGITPAEWLDAVENDRALTGRPVMLTFDDGYRDFATNAWPILGRFGIPATVAIVTDRIEGTADWDRGYGEPAPLMSWAEVARVASEGAVIASHSASHPALTAVSGHELLREALRSRAAITRATGAEPEAVIYPYGIQDPTAREAFAMAGFTVGFGTRPGTATLMDDPMNLPRIDVNGFDDMDTFIRNVTRVDLQTGRTRWASTA
jgi:glycosyltransferase involved in cell wall biosynthesis/peptidoglycan/xylan/chitin deacetylase (PgdA/CDA1 family)